MIRYAFINNQILNIYLQMTNIKFPIDIQSVIKLVPNCRYMSYQRFAEISNCSIEDVIQICESTSGCTHYDVTKGRYLILCNHSTDNNNNPGRQRWTCGHELGHIVCKHHEISAHDKLAENSFLNISDKTYEAEADYFAAMILSPFPLFKILGINSAKDIQRVFGLSNEASENRYAQYIKWLQTRRKTAWENDMIRLCKNKLIVS